MNQRGGVWYFFFTALAYLYEYLRWIERGICMITLLFSVPIAIVKVLLLALHSNKSHGKARQ